ncbi:HET-domain-containing protein [Glonium stellatum]|uniref:HET-domain-containing protein n=1 Tax=Glonium stellatum TaxID=574774 RepID=A0A8E2JNS7_9PEZI|nr:HET-domain-containing protein [Glonium stellatum]
MRYSDSGQSSQITVHIRMVSRILRFRASCGDGPCLFWTSEFCCSSLWALGQLAVRPIWHCCNGSLFQPRLSTVIEWLTDCMTRHPLCRSSNTELPQLPTRVLDLGPPGSSTWPMLFIPNGKRALYTALSHRWGGSANPPLRTTLVNLQNRMKGIDPTTLSKNFQDAIYITRSLTIRYIWIDSLYIVQDDNDDWEQESAKMAAVYEGSHLTIAATAAAHGNVGCLHPFKPSHRFEFHDTVYFMRLVCDENFEALNLDGKSNIAPLSQRGWAFQESLLSRRVLHFGKNQLGWKCVSRHTSEDGVLDLAETDMKLPVRFSGAATPVSLRTFLHMRDHSDRYSAWYRLVEHYSARKFTYSKDKLVALAGVVELFRTMVDDVPLAGLWKNYLHCSLLWEVSTVNKVRQANTIFGIPSWSWAYVDAPVQYAALDDVTSGDIDLLEGILTFSGQELTSRIENARLVVRGHVGDVIVGRRDLSRSSSSMLDPVLGMSSPDISGGGYCHFDFAPYPTGFQLSYLAVSQDRGGNTNILLLTRRNSASADEFSRVGVGKIFRYSAPTESSNYLTQNSTATRVITLI